jgi:hypothetical protein
MVVGGYGSGKTEVSVNLALTLAAEGIKVSIADLDIVNPYFRCREAAELMKGAGIRVVSPPGDRAMADLPIVLPEIKGMLNPPEGELSLFDVGGDPVGARLLSGLSEYIPPGYELWHVVNSRRPFTGTTEGCLKMMADVEESSRLKVTGIIANSHLVTDTAPDVILEGHALALEAARKKGVPLLFTAVMNEMADDPKIAGFASPVLKMTRRMLPPWQRPAVCSDALTDDGPPPARRAVPLGRRAGA